MSHGRRLAVVGLGYVGLPVAVAFARIGNPVIAFDIDPRRIEQLKSGHDRTREVDETELSSDLLRFTKDADQLRGGDFFIVTVPTPLDDARRPDLSALLSASRSVGASLKRGDIVVYESTVYPGATEEDCIPLLESVSGLKGGRDFTVGYSPERINPGDPEHRFETVQKVVSAQDPDTLDVIAEVYGSVVTAGVYRASSIKVAEAAKVIENTQRDLNIAFMNELSAIFHLLEIDTGEVLAAAGTKWNFVPFSPGLVGGHCIGVDPYYLTHRAERAGYHPEVILAGRRINDTVGQRIARECMKRLLARGGRPDRVTVLGLTFKENVPDLRNSKVVDITTELLAFGFSVQVHDPLVSAVDAKQEFGLDLLETDALEPAGAVILAVPHKSYLDAGWTFVQTLLRDGKGLVMDVRGALRRHEKPEGIELWRL